MAEYTGHDADSDVRVQKDGTVVNVWSVGIPNDDDRDFVVTPFETACSAHDSYFNAAHAMFYAKNDSVLWGKYKVYANILMQMRFDGNLGFPGGLVDPEDSSVVDGLNRELLEEMNIGNVAAVVPTNSIKSSESGGSKSLGQSTESQSTNFEIVQSDHIVTHVNHKKKMINHFYAREVTKEQFRDIERKVMDARDWGTETLGIVRIPLYVVDDEARGFPVFLANRFAGNARDQLLMTIRQRAILPVEHFDHAVSCYKDFVAQK